MSTMFWYFIADCRTQKSLVVAIEEFLATGRGEIFGNILWVMSKVLAISKELFSVLSSSSR